MGAGRLGCWLFALLLIDPPTAINNDGDHRHHTQQQAGITSGALASAAVGATNVAGTLIAAGLIEKAGRKQLLLRSYAGMAAAMLLMAAGFVVPALAPYSGALLLLRFYDTTGGAAEE